MAVDGAASALYRQHPLRAPETDYLQADLDASPLLHFWSLGVEEQFYLVWPALLVLVVAAGGRSPAPLARCVVATSASASLALSLVLTRHGSAVGVLSLPTRAWELAWARSLGARGDRAGADPRPAAPHRWLAPGWR